MASIEIDWDVAEVNVDPDSGSLTLSAPVTESAYPADHAWWRILIEEVEDTLALDGAPCKTAEFSQAAAVFSGLREDVLPNDMRSSLRGLVERVAGDADVTCDRHQRREEVEEQQGRERDKFAQDYQERFRQAR